ncbi:MAG: hypothetical protein KJ941_01570 [Bacteroidetes bacterium]|nr:hypothetical protein [Bacteroidota bacterium]
MTDIPKYKVFFFVASIMIVLGISSYVIPDDGINLGFTRITFFSSEKLWFKKKIVQKDITQIVQSVDTSLVVSETEPLQYTGKSNGDMGAPSNAVQKTTSEIFRSSRTIIGKQEKSAHSAFW